MRKKEKSLLLLSTAKTFWNTKKRVFGDYATHPFVSRLLD